jgi:serine/threonine protein phosphatase PrpC
MKIPRVDGYLATSRSLGDWFKRGSTWGDELHIGRRPDITVIDLSEEKPKALILTCDGVTEGVKSDRLIAELVLSQMETDLKVSARNLAAYALAGDSQDNVSVLVIQLKKE